jgi:hypothetical protein
MERAISDHWQAPIRDIKVTAGTFTNCSGYAGATADFEPAPEFTVERALSYPTRAHRDDELEEFCCRHLERNVEAGRRFVQRALDEA